MRQVTEDLDHPGEGPAGACGEGRRPHQGRGSSPYDDLESHVSDLRAHVEGHVTSSVVMVR